MTSGPIPTLSCERDPRVETVVMEGLADFNATMFRPGDWATLDVVVRDDRGGEPMGGLLGHTSYRLFFIELFYLPKELRGGGLGSRIITLAEDEARRRGCTVAFVYTVTFQAPGFYERHGYRRFGEVACPPDGATRIFVSKPLD
jgi:GNAT superfamily N-acetyltransferase